jgi:hypothetical protein
VRERFHDRGSHVEAIGAVLENPAEGSSRHLVGGRGAGLHGVEHLAHAVLVVGDQLPRAVPVVGVDAAVCGADQGDVEPGDLFLGVEEVAERVARTGGIDPDVRGDPRQQVVPDEEDPLLPVENATVPGRVPRRPDDLEPSRSDLEHFAVFQEAVDLAGRPEDPRPDVRGLRRVDRPGRDRDPVAARVPHHVLGPGRERIVDALELRRVEEEAGDSRRPQVLGRTEVVGVVVGSDDGADVAGCEPESAQGCLERCATRLECDAGVDQHPLVPAIEQPDVDDRGLRGERQEDLVDAGRDLARPGRGGLVMRAVRAAAGRIARAAAGRIARRSRARRAALRGEIAHSCSESLISKVTRKSTFHAVMRPFSMIACVSTMRARCSPEIVTAARDTAIATASSIELAEVPVRSIVFSTMLRPSPGERSRSSPRPA